jgi:pyruvate-formate lyase-activating enzyme
MSGAMAAGRRFARRAWEHLIAHPWWRWVVTRQTYVRLRMLFALPEIAGARLTPRRLLNVYLQRIEHGRCRTRLWSKPSRLTVEATNICNLRCPACFTGVGETGRGRSHMSMDLFLRLLDDLGPYLLEVEFYNWGEPLLGKNVYAMIAAAAGRGIATTVSTNFSIPFTAADAERLVRSGLTVLGVSIDGARQESYEQYRKRGSLDLVLRNCRLMQEAKARLGATLPRLVWEFHSFPHNVGDVPLARRMAADLGMDIAVGPGWVIDSDWTGGDVVDWPIQPQPFPCPFLWGQAVVNNDGGVAPCCGTFYREDDCGQVAANGTAGAPRFTDVWNNEQFAVARRFFQAREGTPEERRHVCFDCPTTVMYEDYQRHLRAGGVWMDYTVPFKTNAVYNYFWHRRPARAAGAARRLPMAS